MSLVLESWPNAPVDQIGTLELFRRDVARSML